MDETGLTNAADQFQFLHGLIEGYKLNGEDEGDSEEEEAEGSDEEDLCDDELMAHVLRKKIKYLDREYSSDDEEDASFILGLTAGTAQGQDRESNRQQRKKELKERADAIRRAMDLNSKMRDALLNMEQSLVQILQGILAKKQALKRADCNYKIVDGKEEYDPCTVNRGFYKQFGMPYFKDKDGFACPPNQDTKNKTQRGELIICRLVHHGWKVEEMKALETAIKNCLVHDYKESYEKKSGGQRADDSSTDVAQYASYVMKNSLAVLLQSEPDRRFDWMKVSASKFGDSHSPSECEKMWNLYLKPSINKRKWTEEESRALDAISASHCHQNWESIAGELGTGRSGYLCFMHYQTKLTGFKNKGSWTKEEDTRLTNIVKMCKYGPYVAWSKVCYYVEGRSFSQIYARWNNSLDPHLKKGKFTKKEDSVILECIYKKGKDCREIAKLLGNRNSSQIRERYMNQLKPLIENRVGEWSLDEDRKLLELVQELGDRKSKWAEISRRFQTRSRTQVRHRYGYLKKKMEEDPNFRPEDMERTTKRSNEKVQIEKRKKILANIAKHTTKKGAKATKNKPAKTKRGRNAKVKLENEPEPQEEQPKKNEQVTAQVLRSYRGGVLTRKAANNLVKEILSDVKNQSENENLGLENKSS